LFFVGLHLSPGAGGTVQTQGIEELDGWEDELLFFFFFLFFFLSLFPSFCPPVSCSGAARSSVGERMGGRQKQAAEDENFLPPLFFFPSLLLPFHLTQTAAVLNRATIR